MPYVWYAYESDEDIVLAWEVPFEGEGNGSYNDVTLDDEGEISSCEAFKSKYENLPYYLKSCFDYCCLFTSKHHINRYRELEIGRLVRLLVAEGLIEEKAGEIIEERAENIIDELLGLGFLRLKDNGYRDYITVPEPFFQFSVLQGNKEDFIAKAADSPIRAFIRLHHGKRIPHVLKSLPIKSLFMTDFAKVLQADLAEILKNFQFLLVLDFYGYVTYLPIEVGDLFNLRFLSLNSTSLVELPRTIDKLQCLQTFEGSFSNIPLEIFNIKTLKHLLPLYILNSHKAVPMRIGSLLNLQSLRKVYAGDGIVSELSALTQSRIGNLLNLQSLCNVSAGDGIASELGALTQMRKLSVLVSDDHIGELLAAIMNMKNLVSLKLAAEVIYIEGEERFQIFPTTEYFSPPPALQELCLSGSLIEMPEWISFMRNLTRIILKYSDLSEKQASILQFLPKLRSLNLYNACKEKVISKEFCTSGGFPELEVMIIRSSFLVEWTEIVNGAFPRLKCLQFIFCSNLMFLPEGLQNISTLQELSLNYSHPDLARRLNGSENYKIKHILNVKIAERLY